ncbi:MAG: tetratricopeptide repeat protein [Rhodospirillales bacterium]|nr:tetratricopeptide repeat protein [Rhodospirillales bacterium]
MPESEIDNLMETAVSHHDHGELKAAAVTCRDILNRVPAHTGALNLLGSILADAGNFDQAVHLLKDALVTGGANPSVLFNYGVALAGADRLVEASRAFKIAAEAAPERADCWFNLGETYRRLGKPVDAVPAFSQAVALNPADVLHRLTLGDAYLQTGQPAEAVEQFQALVDLAPGDLSAQNALGVALRHAGNPAASEEIFKKLVAAHPGDPAVLNNYGLTLTERKKFSEAETALLRALDVAPDYHDARINLADVYAADANFDAAAASLETALSSGSEDKTLQIKLGLMHQKRGRLGEARRVLEPLAGQGVPNADVALANVLRDVGTFETARSLLTSPPHHDIPELTRLTNLGLIHLHAGDTATATTLLRDALALQPENPDLHLSLAHALLLNGDMAAGWEAYEGRLKDQTYTLRSQTLPGRPWTGENLTRKSILVTSEQGAGDCFQFVRYVRRLAETTGTVWLSVPPRLRRLMDGALEGCRICDTDNLPQDVDHHVPLMSLPHVMEEAVLPVEGAYLSADTSRVDAWANRVHLNGPNIGLAWQGNRAYETDYLRSIPAPHIADLVNATSHSLISLQRDGRALLGEDLPRLMDFTHEMDGEHGFVDTAALMMSLDLIITSDTAIAHLAGALGRPVWVLLNSAPDWRWQLERFDSPWYPTMKLFRQRAPRDWSGVLADVEKELKTVF